MAPLIEGKTRFRDYEQRMRAFWGGGREVDKGEVAIMYFIFSVPYRTFVLNLSVKKYNQCRSGARVFGVSTSISGHPTDLGGWRSL